MGICGETIRKHRILFPSIQHLAWGRARYLWKKIVILSYPLHSTPPLGGFAGGSRRNIATPFGKKKLEWFRHNTGVWQTDRRTDGHLATAYTRYAYTSHSKNRTVFAKVMLKRKRLQFFWLTVYKSLVMNKSIKSTNFNAPVPQVVNCAVFLRSNTANRMSNMYKKLSYRWQTARRCFVKLLRYCMTFVRKRRQEVHSRLQCSISCTM